MDTGLGKFAEISEAVHEDAREKEMHGVFQVGEILEIRGSKFQIHNINKFGMKLHLMPRNKP